MKHNIIRRKVKKYRTKMRNTDSQDKLNIYKTKLKYYKKINQSGGVDKENELAACKKKQEEYINFAQGCVNEAKKCKTQLDQYINERATLNNNIKDPI